MGAEGAVAILYREKIKEASDPLSEKAKLIEEYEEQYMTPYTAAERGYIDEVIFPEETREKLASAMNMLSNKDRLLSGYRPHGNIPL